MGNAFLNWLETAQDVACLVLQIPITRMTGQVLFIQTADPDKI